MWIMEGNAIDNNNVAVENSTKLPTRTLFYRGKTRQKPKPTSKKTDIMKEKWKNETSSKLPLLTWTWTIMFEKFLSLSHCLMVRMMEVVKKCLSDPSFFVFFRVLSLQLLWPWRGNIKKLSTYETTKRTVGEKMESKATEYCEKSEINIFWSLSKKKTEIIIHSLWRMNIEWKKRESFLCYFSSLTIHSECKNISNDILSFFFLLLFNFHF